jgi:predicted nucleic acid-binding protein
VRVVVDASVALKWYFDEAGSAAADRLLEAGIEGERELLAPDLVAAEFANVLWKKVRRGECEPDEARGILSLWEVDRPLLVPSVDLVPRALELALALEHPVYDCLYLAAAVESAAALATADRQLARVARMLLAEVELVA